VFSLTESIINFNKSKRINVRLLIFGANLIFVLPKINFVVKFPISKLIVYFKILNVSLLKFSAL